MVNDGKHLWIFGGINDHNTLDDMWKFDLTTKRWDKIEQKNSP